MKHYVFYDKQTGQVRHVHHVISAETERPVEVADKELSAMVSRIIDPKSTASLYVEVPTTSSRAAVRHVDLKKHRLVTKRLTARAQERLRRREG